MEIGRDLVGRFQELGSEPDILQTLPSAHFLQLFGSELSHPSTISLPSNFLFVSSKFAWSNVQRRPAGNEIIAFVAGTDRWSLLARVTAQSSSHCNATSKADAPCLSIPAEIPHFSSPQLAIRA